MRKQEELQAFQDMLAISREQHAQCEDFLSRCRKFRADNNPQKLQEQSQRLQDELGDLHRKIHDASEDMQKEQQNMEEAQRTLSQLQNESVERQAKMKGELHSLACQYRGQARGLCACMRSYMQWKS